MIDDANMVSMNGLIQRYRLQRWCLDQGFWFCLGSYTSWCCQHDK